MDQGPADVGGQFGYRRSPLNRLLSDRDIMLRQTEARAAESEARAEQAEARAAQAEARATEAEARAEAAEEARARLEADLERVRDGLAALGDEGALGAAGEAEPGDHVATLLAEVRQSAARLLEGARADAELRVSRAQENWGAVQEQVSRFAEWRSRTEPEVHDAVRRIASLRERIDEAPTQLRRAFEPLAAEVSSLDAELGALTGGGAAGDLRGVADRVGQTVDRLRETPDLIRVALDRLATELGSVEQDLASLTESWGPLLQDPTTPRPA